MTDKEFALTIQPEILILAREILGEHALTHIDEYSLELFENNKDQVIAIMQSDIGTIPKRPLYYLNWELKHLPEQTRDVVRYAGDYIDQLMKHFAYGNMKVLPTLRAQYTSLGGNIEKFKKYLTPELHDQLKQYNKFIYVPAKHDMDVVDRPHRFSTKDAVSICYITLQLAKTIISISVEAEAYSKQEVLYF